jgi:hypothetical protein
LRGPFGEDASFVGERGDCRVVGVGGGALGRGVDLELTVEPVGLFCAGEDVKAGGRAAFGDAGRVAGDDRGLPAGDRGARLGNE